MHSFGVVWMLVHAIVTFPPVTEGWEDRVRPDAEPARMAELACAESESRRADPGLPDLSFPAFATCPSLTRPSDPAQDEQPPAPDPDPAQAETGRRDRRFAYLRHDTYAELRGGPFFGSGTRSRIDRYTFAEIEIGRRVTEHGAALVQFDYLEGDETEAGVDTNVLALQFLVGGTGRVALGPCDLYAGAGVGMGYARFKRTGTGVRVYDDAFMLVANARAGVTVNLTSRLFIEVEGRWNGTTDGKADDVKFNVNGYGALASFGLRF